ncbi:MULTISPECIES: helix-turn-helix domain-containing protein [unclassified Caldicellulosiruptor]|nr:MULTISPECIES: helix-turn-helix domain-containing protein [unclassified Caldicellulosiruptor]
MKISYIPVKGFKIRTLGIKQRYTIRDLAKLAGVHYSTIALIEKGI